MVQFQQHNNPKQLHKSNSTNDRKNPDNELNDLLEAIMSDGGDLDVIKTRQRIFGKVLAITTLVEQYTYK